MVISIGEFIRFFRKRHGLSQAALADILEITTKGLSKIENGGSAPRAYTIKLFEDFFKVKTSRYYQNSSQMTSLASYELMWEMLMCTASGNYKKAHKLAVQFESSDAVKSNEVNLNINYAKARFYADFAESYEEALLFYKKGLAFEDYVHFDDAGVLVIESFMPSVSGLQLLANMAKCLNHLGRAESAMQVLEATLDSLKKFLDLPLLMNFCYSKEDVLFPYSLIENLLSGLYFEHGRFEDALRAVEQSLGSKTVFGAFHMEEKLTLKFKSLCSLKRTGEAVLILPDVLFHSKRAMDEQSFGQFVTDLRIQFPEVGKQITSLANMLETMCSIFVENSDA